jgi:hypothetical protein
MFRREWWLAPRVGALRDYVLSWMVAERLAPRVGAVAFGTCSNEHIFKSITPGHT